MLDRLRLDRAARTGTPHRSTWTGARLAGCRVMRHPGPHARLLATEIADRGSDELVFPSRRGGYVTLGEVRWVFDPAATAIDQAGLTPHDLRHTCASLSIAAGCNVKVLQRLLGHKSATMTLDRYGHLFPDDLGRIADAFEAAAASAADGLRTILASAPLTDASNGR